MRVERKALRVTRPKLQQPIKKEKISRRENVDRRDIDPESSPIKIIEATEFQARTALMPAKVNSLKMSIMIVLIKLF